MIITEEWLNTNNACSEGIEYCEQEGLIGLPAAEFVEKLIEAEKLSWANWLVAHALGKIDKVRYAARAAELVLPIYEEIYPTDDRPRRAIEAAKAYIDDPCADAACAARATRAADAAYAAAYAAYAADAAAYAADAAHAADAADAAAHAADAAAHATAHAATYAAGEETYIKIIRYGIDLLKNKEV